MNIFYLDEQPRTAARYHCDKHVVKMVLETAQLLSTAHHELGSTATYKSTHKNHPSALWVRSSRQHYEWAVELWLALMDEYTARYKKVHACARLIDELSTPPKRIPDAGWVQPPQCMPDEYHRKCAVDAYRAYYVGAKAPICRWAHSPTPNFFQ